MVDDGADNNSALKSINQSSVSVPSATGVVGSHPWSGSLIAAVGPSTSAGGSHDLSAVEGDKSGSGAGAVLSRHQIMDSFQFCLVVSGRSTG